MAFKDAAPFKKKGNKMEEKGAPEEKGAKKGGFKEAQKNAKKKCGKGKC